MALNLLDPRKDEELQYLWIHLLTKSWCSNFFFLAIFLSQGDLLAPLNFLFWDPSRFQHRPRRQPCRVADWWDEKSRLRAVLKTPGARAHLPWHWQSSPPAGSLRSLSVSPSAQRGAVGVPRSPCPASPKLPTGAGEAVLALAAPGGKRREERGRKGGRSGACCPKLFLWPAVPHWSRAQHWQRPAAHPAVQALSLLTVYSNKQG